jgi:hypothetical protein
MFIVGTTDCARLYHVFGIYLTIRENPKDFCFMFGCLKDLSRRILNRDYEPTVLVADCVDRITNGTGSTISIR